ncbi:AraC family transcriptional regulator [Paraflavitalea soli]|uniref:AraC family transcriptional regulator n=1 Tax=Paraflavitalea soli TaxID=2315862 RepID=A0A3B7MTJ2_9BACT|nr:AraC family transcriptional regulator [Paraflavitalea soli]AXY77187.1 AraC family transcriptional regulator [Paraflavitalea soli]
MLQAPDILSFAYKQPMMQGQLDLLYEKEQQIPGSIQYNISRFRKHSQWAVDDAGMMVYHYKKNDAAKNYVELRFCVSGNVYCHEKDTECDQCKLGVSRNCNDRVDSVDVLSFRFAPVHLTQFLRPRRQDDEVTVTDNILQFTHPSSFSKILPLCGRTRVVLEALLNHTYTGSLENIYINAQVQMLLLYSLECMLGEDKGDKAIETFQCKFLANDADREKIIRAREILLQHIGEPITIKELSRKVAINECYLKKGFKELFGTTVFDFYQSQRMEHARYLLYEKGLSVTEVSMMLGYSSISHFSTAFKKHTGLKPCELLLH